MGDTQTRDALKARLDELSDAHLAQVAGFIDNMLAAEDAAIMRSASIRALPRIITDHPILVWGWDPCDNNSICEVWFGPLTTPVVNVRKNYPQHRRLNRYESKAMLVATQEGYEYTFASGEPGAWVAGAQVSTEELRELLAWAFGEDDWPQVYNAADNTLQLAGLKQVEAEADWLLESLGESVCEVVEMSLRRVINHIQDELSHRGTNLSADYAEVGFSFNRESGTIDYLDGRKFIPLVNRTLPAEPTGILMVSEGSVAGMDLSGASLVGLMLAETEMNMRGVNLSGADLTDANLGYADLTGANLTGANLTRARLDGVIFDENTRWPDGFTPPGGG